jgi:hypothetical protein
VILWYRLTPACLTLLTIISFAGLILAPYTFFWPAISAFALIPLVLGRLLLWEWRRPGFWIFLITPMVFLLTAFGFFVLLEEPAQKWALMGVVAFGVWLYTENLFAFYHLPSTYQAYSLEHLTSAMYVMVAFFFGSATFLGQIFGDLPSWLIALLTFFLMTGAALSVNWVGKVSYEQSLPYALLTGWLLAQLHLLLSWLPMSFLPSAALMAVTTMALFVLSRAAMHDKLTRTVWVRQGVIFMGTWLLILSTATWR